MYKQSECPSRNGTIQWKISVCIIQEMILCNQFHSLCTCKSDIENLYPFGNPISLGKQTSKISITIHDDISMTFHSLPS